MQRKKSIVRGASVAALVLVVAACGSSASSKKTSSGGSTAAATGGTLTIGFISDVTGAAASGFATNPEGYGAVLQKVNAAGGINGQQLKVILADTTSTPTGALTAAQKLVQQDHVQIIMENSGLFYGAEPYLLKQGIPVVGSAIDGPEWSMPNVDTNLISATGVIDETQVPLAEGQYAKQRGATSCGAVSYAGSVSASEAAEGFNQSCKTAGLKAVYLDTQIPFGSIDVAPVALAIKKAGIDALFTGVEPATAFALIATLHGLGVTLKSSIVADGYGGDLLQSPAGVQAGQGIDFSTEGAPAEAGTAAGKVRAADLAAVGVKGDPTFGEQFSYLVATALETILKAAPPHPNAAQFLAAAKTIHNYDANGLLAPEKITFDQVPQPACTWIAKLQGNGFVVPPNTPVCAGYEPLQKTG